VISAQFDDRLRGEVSDVLRDPLLLHHRQALVEHAGGDVFGHLLVAGGVTEHVHLGQHFFDTSADVEHTPGGPTARTRTQYRQRAVGGRGPAHCADSRSLHRGGTSRSVRLDVDTERP